MKAQNNITSSLQKSLSYFSDQSIEGIVVLDRAWEVIYSNNKFQHYWTLTNFRILYERMIPILKVKEKLPLDQDTTITSLLREDGELDPAFLLGRTLDLQITIHDLEDSYLIRFKPEESLLDENPKKSEHFDRITNLPNKNYFLNHFRDYISSGNISGKEHYFFLISISNPDAIVSNEDNAYFHAVSVKVSDRLKKYLNQEEFLFKIETDKFLISAAHLDTEAKAEWFAECLVLLFNFPFIFNEREFHLNINIGYSHFTKNSGADLNSLRILKEALHRANVIGPNSYFYYDKNAISETTEKAKIEIDLRKVISRNELEIHFQPIINLKENRIFSMEALVRWNHPQKGKLLPGSFIGIAENSSFIKTIGEWMIWETFRYYENSVLESQNILLSLNLSPKQLGDKNIIPLLKEAGNYYNIQPDRIILEIIEDSFDTYEAYIGKVVNTLRDYGFKFAIDDFGKGYSSLGRLINLPIDYIKLDKIFLFNYFKTSTRTIITSLVNLIQAMDKAIIVEGVENEMQHGLLQELNCDFGQGYHYSRPMEIATAETFVQNKAAFYS
ncbi:EAL domain-containing protein [Leptospira sp. WS92.C1]